MIAALFVIQTLQNHNCITICVPVICVFPQIYLSLYSLRIVGNAEERPMNVKVTPTAEAGGMHVEVLSSIFCLSPYPTSENL